MNLIRVSRDVMIDKDKVQALVSEQYNGKFYTHIYLMGDRGFLVEGYVKDIEKLINESEERKMTREGAIKAIKSHCYFANLVPAGKEALDMAIEALEREPCDDAISRKWTLDVVNNFVFDTETDRNKVIHIVRDTAPSVAPKQKTGK